MSFTRPPEVWRRERGHAFYPPARQIAAIPALYATDGVPAEEKIIHVHYFAAWGDWYIAEYDPSDGEAFGWTCINDDELNAEWGYVDLPALESHRRTPGLPRLVERDLHFTPKSFAECMDTWHRNHCRTGRLRHNGTEYHLCDDFADRTGAVWEFAGRDEEGTAMLRRVRVGGMTRLAFTEVAYRFGPLVPAESPEVE